MMEILTIGCEEGEIKKAQRLGKCAELGKACKLLVEFCDGHVNNVVMENASK